MNVNISLFKDISEAIKAGSEAITKFVEAIISAASGATRAYDHVAARRERRNLLSLSARLTNLGEEFNMPVVHSIEEYIAKEERTMGDWLVVRRAVQTAICEVDSILTDVRSERSAFVLHSAYAEFSSGLHTRMQLLKKLDHVEKEPPSSPEELQALGEVRERYNVLVSQLREAIKALNIYLGEEYYNKHNFTDKELLQHIR